MHHLAVGLFPNAAKQPLHLIMLIIDWILRTLPKRTISILGTNARWDKILLPKLTHRTLFR